jgi:transcriptional regulator with XRE-family HTH domain
LASMRLSNLRHIRESKGLTQKELASMVDGANQGRISAIENGMPVSKFTARKLALALDCSIEALQEEVLRFEVPMNRMTPEMMLGLQQFMK